MRYIKKFKESKVDSFQEESENLLSYYIDEHKAKVTVIPNGSYEMVYIKTLHFIRWGDCKEDLISYLTYINDKYSLDTITLNLNFPQYLNNGQVNIRFATIRTINKEVVDDTLYKMVDDLESIDDDFQFWEIYFKVKL